ncbi:hypothetical protein IE53DRAFT_90859 [Violaceomyces palustris]|uniref:Uncharacterized protein n=1 Tax=Violaceomyces palustris TaxID=1673888 RepID=A0ACD0P715_9BASI|nr:hypothetical protein IE53DRAFT_90859 [Violaceomyces palustris]
MWSRVSYATLARAYLCPKPSPLAISSPLTSAFPLVLQCESFAHTKTRLTSSSISERHVDISFSLRPQATYKGHRLNRGEVVQQDLLSYLDHDSSQR